MTRLFAELLKHYQIKDGLARVPDRPGIGLTWRSEAVKALLLDR